MSWTSVPYKTQRLSAVHDTNGLASYLIKSYDDTDGTLSDFE